MGTCNQIVRAFPAASMLLMQICIVSGAGIAVEGRRETHVTRLGLLSAYNCGL